MKEEKITIKQASSIMKKSDEFIRAGLRNGTLPFGGAVKLSSRWSYYISPTLFYEFIGNRKEEAL